VTASAKLVEVTRTDVRSGDEVVESKHRGHLVVATADAEVVAALGDPDRRTFVRSTAKPFQATACLELLGASGDHLSGPEVALAWSSHRGERIHLDTARRLIDRSGTAPYQLTCPPAVSEADPGASATRLAHDCSGKHGLFALAGQHQGTPRDRLLDPEGPLQRVVGEVLAEVFGPPLAVGVDGCGAPAIAAPLVRLAAGFAALAGHDRWWRVRDAGLADPVLVGGTGRLETALLGAGVVAKVGAEGVFAAGWIDGQGAPRGLAVKAEDGTPRGAATATIAVLAGAGVVEPGTWAPEPVLGGGRPAGRVRAVEAVAGLLT
jgi:L-asparaginase II